MGTYGEAYGVSKHWDLSLLFLPVFINSFTCSFIWQILISIYYGFWKCGIYQQVLSSHPDPKPLLTPSQHAHTHIYTYTCTLSTFRVLGLMSIVETVTIWSVREAPSIKTLHDLLKLPTGFQNHLPSWLWAVLMVYNSAHRPAPPQDFPRTITAFQMVAVFLLHECERVQSPSSVLTGYCNILVPFQNCRNASSSSGPIP